MRCRRLLLRGFRRKIWWFWGWIYTAKSLLMTGRLAGTGNWRLHNLWGYKFIQVRLWVVWEFEFGGFGGFGGFGVFWVWVPVFWAFCIVVLWVVDYVCLGSCWQYVDSSLRSHRWQMSSLDGVQLIQEFRVQLVLKIVIWIHEEKTVVKGLAQRYWAVVTVSDYIMWALGYVHIGCYSEASFAPLGIYRDGMVIEIPSKSSVRWHEWLKRREERKEHTKKSLGMVDVNEKPSTSDYTADELGCFSVEWVWLDVEFVRKNDNWLQSWTWCVHQRQRHHRELESPMQQYPNFGIQVKESPAINERNKKMAVSVTCCKNRLAQFPEIQNNLTFSWRETVPAYKGLSGDDDATVLQNTIKST